MDEIKFTNKDSIIEFSCNGKLGFLIIDDEEISIESPADPYASFPSEGAKNFAEIAANQNLMDRICDKIVAYSKWEAKA